MGKSSRAKRERQAIADSNGQISQGLGEVINGARRAGKNQFKKLRNLVMPRVKAMIDQVAAYPAGADRAKGIHKGIDEQVEAEFEKNGHTDKITCRRGCGFCCHLPVGVTSDEADLLVDCIRGGVTIDRELLAKQASWPESPGAWYHKPPAENRCVFLSETNDCRVYENRPAACRLYYSVDDPSRCDVSTGSVMHAKVVSIQGEIAYSAALTVSTPGFMPKMLSERLKD